MKGVFSKIIIIMSMICAFSILVEAYAMAASLKDIDSMAKDFIDAGSTETDTISSAEEKMSDIVVPIAQILVGIGTVTVVVVATIMGIKYMVANPEEKAKLKTQLIGLVVATIVIFAAQFIWSTIYKFFVDF